MKDNFAKTIDINGFTKYNKVALGKSCRRTI